MTQQFRRIDLLMEDLKTHRVYSAIIQECSRTCGTSHKHYNRVNHKLIYYKTTPSTEGQKIKREASVSTYNVVQCKHNLSSYLITFTDDYSRYCIEPPL